MASIGANYDPPTTAAALAEQFVSGRQSLLTRHSTQATATEKGLTTLQTAMKAFQTKLQGLTGVGKTIVGASAVFSDPTRASAKAGPLAAAGSYSFFVAQVASAHKISYSGMSAIPAVGTLTFKVGGAGFDIDLASKPSWTVRDLAAAINGAADNTGMSAAVVTTGATSELVLTSKLTGAANVVGVTHAGIDPALATQLDATPNPLVAAADAILHVGSEGGTPITQSTNTFNVIDGVSISVTRAQQTGEPALGLTVATDNSATTANVQSFVDAYNEMTKTVDGLVQAGKDASGVFANDSGVRALRERLVSMLRVSTGGVSLASYGIIANRDGSLSVNSARLTKTLAANPTGLDTLLGSTASGATSGLAGTLNGYLDGWTNSSNGQIQSRKQAVTRMQVDLTTRQTQLDRQYDGAYARYLDQFSRLQAMQGQMSYNTSLFDSLFGGDSKD